MCDKEKTLILTCNKRYILIQIWIEKHSYGGEEASVENRRGTRGVLGKVFNSFLTEDVIFDSVLNPFT